MNDILSKIKSKSVNMNIISHLEPNDIINTMASWPTLFTMWELPDDDMPNTSKPWFERKRWYWKGVIYNSSQAAIELGTNFKLLLTRCKEAYAIHPDGTYNKEFLATLTSIKENKNANK